MRTKYLVITAALSMVVVAGLVFHDKLLPAKPGGDAQADKTSHASAAAMSAGVPTVKTPGGAGATENRDDTRPAWMNAPDPTSAVRPSATPTMGASNRENDERAARMRAAMSRLEKLQGQKDPDPRAVDEALAEVERAHGSSVLQGVRLDVLRENLRVAARMQKAAGELQSLQQRSAAGELKPAEQAELNRKLAEMEALQRELRMDFFVSNPAPARQ